MPASAGVHVDIGAGDGGYAYRSARSDPRRFVIAIDANADAMAERSRRAAAKPARGGAANVIFVRANIEALPAELDGLATRVTVLFPWGSLLRAVAGPVPTALAGLRRLARDGASLGIVLALSVPRERPSFERAGLPEIDERHLRSDLTRAYAESGLDVTVHELARDALDGYSTTWGKRLVFDPSRRFFAITGTATRLWEPKATA